MSLSIFLYGYSITLNDNYSTLEKSFISYNSENHDYFKNKVVVTPLNEDKLVNEGKIYLCICPDVNINVFNKL